ncbi:hypothetical protein EJ07DRAFT_170668 [Lizonia empirigonia]|nr:hypothetical protein EJ07DRAFT_170668 [Lizonia empirigonia]
MPDNKNVLTTRENEVLALAWQCFEADPKYTKGSATFTLGKIKTKLKALTAGVTEDNPVPLVKKGAARTKRAAKNDDEDVSAPAKRKKGSKKAGAVTDMTSDEVDAALGLGGRGKREVKIKDEPEEL